MPGRWVIWLTPAAVGAACLVAAGCSDSPIAETPVTAVPATRASPKPAEAKAEESATTPALPEQQADSRPSSSSPAADNAPAAAPAQDAAAAPAGDKPSSEVYKPPFPDRVDLFVAPKRQGGATLGDSELSVELLGFIRVHKPRVILSINGQIAPIAEGDSELGVEVISIQAPTVVLQRGRQRWQATLQN